MGINKYPHNSFFEGMSQILLSSNNWGSWVFAFSFAQRLIGSMRVSQGT